MHILLLEDRRDALRIHEALLRTAGHSTRRCQAVADAVRSLNAERFDLLVTDGQLPDGHGCEVMARARAFHGLRGVVIAAYLNPGDEQAYRAAGFASILIGPIWGEELLRAIVKISILPPPTTPLRAARGDPVDGPA